MLRAPQVPSTDLGDCADQAAGYLQRQTRIFETTLSAITDFAYIFDREGRFVYANKALLDLWGLKLEEAVGKNFYELHYPAELAERLHRQIEQVYQTGQQLSDETPYTSPTGAGGYYEYIFCPVLAADGSVEVVAGSTRDISERKRTQILLDAQRQSLELVVSGKPLGEILVFLTQIVEQQSNGHAIAAILLLDSQGCLRIGAAPSLPDDYNDAIDGLRARADLGTCSVAAVTGQIVVTSNIDVDPKWQDIKHLPAAQGLKAAWSRPILARDGTVLGTFGTYFRICREPTAFERQVVEILSQTAALAIERSRSDEERERLLASEREAHAQADAANRAKDRFLAVLSHELRTPLAPVVMTLPVIETDPDLPPKFREDLAMLRRNVDLEVKLIDDLLDLSRIASGKLRLEVQPVGLHGILRHAIQTCATDAAAKRLIIREELHAGNDCLSGDPARLQQVFWNLVRNAVKFTPDGGAVAIRTRNAPQGNQVIVEVQDSGVGIPAELLPRIFDAFEQGDPRITRQFGGLGLGLAIARAVVEIHGGSITASSPGANRGATFTVALKTVSQQTIVSVSSPNGNGTAPQANGRARVLLVEDHADTARVLARLLQRFGYHVQTANSVETALHAAAAERFDVLVSDIGLPDASGYRLMQEIRSRYGLKGIALSGYGMEEDLRKSRDAGFVEHVTKPVNVEQLRSVIDRVVNMEPTAG